MKKEEIRKEAIKLRFKYRSYAKIQRILEEKYKYSVSKKTIKLWWKKFNRGDWNLRDESTKPNTIHYKFYAEDIEQVINLRKVKSYSSYQLRNKLKWIIS